MAKFMSFFAITLLLSFVIASNARSNPGFTINTALKAQQADIEAGNVGVEDVSCEGVGTEECLTRRTLAAHLDYIYTQEQKP